MSSQQISELISSIILALHPLPFPSADAVAIGIAIAIAAALCIVCNFVGNNNNNCQNTLHALLISQIIEPQNGLNAPRWAPANWCLMRILTSKVGFKPPRLINVGPNGSR